MEGRHSRQLAALALFLLCLALTSWLEETYRGNVISRSKRSTDDSGKPGVETVMKKTKVKHDLQFEKLKQKVLSHYIGGEEDEKNHIPEGPKNSRPSHGPVSGLTSLEDVGEEEDNDLQEFEEVYSKLLEERAQEIKRKVYKCLPKFICEVHSQSPDSVTTDLEKEWLTMYSPNMLMEPAHEFQVAAHMGQLFRGFQPSPCHQLYTSCPVTMTQFKKFLSTFTIKRAY